jgi:hypothetical protein
MFCRNFKRTSNVMRTIISQQPKMNVRHFVSPTNVEEAASVKNVTSIDADAPINFQPGKMSELEAE